MLIYKLGIYKFIYKLGMFITMTYGLIQIIFENSNQYTNHMLGTVKLLIC